MKHVSLREITSFIKSTYNFLCFKLPNNDISEISKALQSVNNEFVTYKGLQFEESNGKADLHFWILKELQPSIV
jgi:hypothetical protein